jgi:hypothetical protein
LKGDRKEYKGDELEEQESKREGLEWMKTEELEQMKNGNNIVFTSQGSVSSTSRQSDI